MFKCECAEGCPFFNGRMAQTMPAIVESMKKKYCQGDNSECARYMVFKAKGKPTVPDNLIPNQINQARAIINE